MATDNRAKSVGHIPSGLFIITAKHSDTDTIDGFLGSWVQQVSFEPLLISLSIKEGRPAFDAIMKGDIFTINIVGKHDGSYLKHFWGGYDPQASVFDTLDYEETSEGAVLLKQALSTMVCRKHSSSKPGDHHVVIAEVVEGFIHADDARPNVHIRKSGLDY